VTEERFLEMRREVADKKAGDVLREAKRGRQYERRLAVLETLWRYGELFPDKIKPPRVAFIENEYRVVRTWFGLKKKRVEDAKRGITYNCPECGIWVEREQYRGATQCVGSGLSYLRVWTYSHCPCGWEYAERKVEGL